jgi:hypothetical protein
MLEIGRMYYIHYIFSKEKVLQIPFAGAPQIFQKSSTNHQILAP